MVGGRGSDILTEAIHYTLMPPGRLPHYNGKTDFDDRVSGVESFTATITFDHDKDVIQETLS